MQREQPPCRRILEPLLERVGCELSAGSLTSHLPGGGGGRRHKLVINTSIISDAGPDAGAGGSPAHPAGEERSERPKGGSETPSAGRLFDS